MEAARLSVGAEDLTSRIRQRLVGLSNTTRQAIWTRGAHRTLVRGDTVAARLLKGWLLVSVELEAAETGRRPLEFVFFLGAQGQADGNTAAVRINAATPEATQLAEVWGDDLQRVIWDAVLDAIQVSLRTAGGRYPNQPLTLRGFQAAPEGILVDVIAGEI